LGTQSNGNLKKKINSSSKKQFVEFNSLAKSYTSMNMKNI